MFLNFRFVSKLFPPVMIFLLVTLIYIPSVQINFINDEIYFIRKNVVENYESFFSLLLKLESGGVFYRPMGNILTALLTQVFDYHVSLYRIFGIFFHFLNSLTVYYFMRKLIQDKNRKNFVSILTAGFFAVNPIQLYAVVWITDIFDRLMFLFYLLSLYTFITSKEKGHFPILSLTLFFLSMMSKEMAFSLPLLIVLISFSKSEGNRILRLKYGIIDSIPYIFLLILFVGFRLIILKNEFITEAGLHSNISFQNLVKNYAFFFGILSFPFYLTEINDLIKTYSSEFILVLSISILLIIYVSYRFRKSLEQEFFGYWWTTLTLIPVLRLFLRWYVYLPSVGFGMMVASLLSKVKSIFIKYLIIILILSIYGFELLNQQIVWRNLSRSADKIIKTFIEEYDNLKLYDDKLLFLNIPGKVNDLPTFQLGFDYHLNNYLSKPHNIQVASKCRLIDLNDKIEYAEKSGKIILRLYEGSFFNIDIEDIQTGKISPKIGELLSNDFFDYRIVELDKHSRITSLEFSIKSEHKSSNVFVFTEGKFAKITR